jgi:hypothetical protein
MLMVISRYYWIEQIDYYYEVMLLMWF